MAELELVGGESLRGHRDVLFLATSVCKAEVDELDLFLLHHLQHVVGRGHARISWDLNTKNGTRVTALQNRGLFGVARNMPWAVPRRSRLLVQFLHKTRAAAMRCAPCWRESDTIRSNSVRRQGE